MGRVLFLDEDLMGNRRGAHRDGAQLCSQFVLTLPKNENDLSGLHCSTCGRRDAEHVLISQPCDLVSGASLVPASPAPAPQLAQREPSSAGTTAARRSQQQASSSTSRPTPWRAWELPPPRRRGPQLLWAARHRSRRRRKPSGLQDRLQGRLQGGCRVPTSSRRRWSAWCGWRRRRRVARRKLRPAGRACRASMTSRPR